MQFQIYSFVNLTFFYEENTYMKLVKYSKIICCIILKSHDYITPMWLKSYHKMMHMVWHTLWALNIYILSIIMLISFSKTYLSPVAVSSKNLEGTWFGGKIVPRVLTDANLTMGSSEVILHLIKANNKFNLLSLSHWAGKMSYL